VVAVLYLCYSLARGLNRGDVVQADKDGWDVLTLERTWRISPEGWLNAHLQAAPLLAVPACYIYATMYLIVTPCVLVWAYRSDAPIYLHARTTLALTTFGALLGFWLYPTAPPRLLAGAGFHDTLQSFHAWGWWGSETSLPSGTGSLANDFAAMPSLHVAWSVWCAATLVALLRRRSLKLVAVAYPIITVVVVLATANHYLLDALAGAAIWVVADCCVRTRPWVWAPVGLPVGGRSER
jgi:hypothetical protein